jgi:thioesterase domain-containing protein
VLDDGVVQGHRDYSFQSIEEAASSCLSLITSILNTHYQDKKDRYALHLAGWSYGGVIAAEVAKQLTSSKDHVEIDLRSVSMFDAPLRGDVVSEEEDDLHVNPQQESERDANKGNNNIMNAAHDHFEGCTRLLRAYHKRPEELQPLTCTILDIRPAEGQILAISSDSVGELSTGRIEKRVSPGNHWTMLNRDHVSNVVQFLNEVAFS